MVHRGTAVSSRWMGEWLVWILVAVGFGVGELVTNSFFLAPFAAGGILAALVAAAGAGVLASTAVFLLVSILTLATITPLARRRLLSTPHTRTGAAALIGKKAIVLERIANEEGVGCVKIDGEVWTARSLDDDREIEAGTRVEVVDIKGATALVME
jgi:membrane protein implicated in regulation of membrane protease activity